MRGVATALVLALAVAGCFEAGGHRVVPRDYLSQETYTKWVIEVDSSTGEQPPAALLDFAKARLASVVHKESIEFRKDEVLQDGDTEWTDADVQDFAKRHRGLRTGGDTVVTHLLFLAGHSEHDEGERRVLGVAYGHELIVIFSRSVKSVCDGSLPVPGLCQTDPVFRAVLVHEFGHALGLVDNGVPMVKPHKAATCDGQKDDGHSSNEDSVMYCQVESSSIVPIFGSNPPTDFDADDRADLRAAGGR